jgi:hypothetical protein
MPLWLAAGLSNEATMRAIQLAVEYVPQPHFDDGRLESASEQEREMARNGFSQP